MSALSATSKLCFEQPAASFLVCSLIFIEYQRAILASLVLFAPEEEKYVILVFKKKVSLN